MTLRERLAAFVVLWLADKVTTQEQLEDLLSDLPYSARHSAAYKALKIGLGGSL